MKRDWELIRRALVYLENQEGSAACLLPDELPGYDAALTAEHLHLLAEAGMIHAERIGSFGSQFIKATGLTWAGHDFLDSIRNPGLWNTIKKTAREKGLDLSFTVITKAAGLLIEKALQ